MFLLKILTLGIKYKIPDMTYKTLPDLAPFFLTVNTASCSLCSTHNGLFLFLDHSKFLLLALLKQTTPQISGSPQ